MGIFMRKMEMAKSPFESSRTVQRVLAGLVISCTFSGIGWTQEDGQRVENARVAGENQTFKAEVQAFLDGDRTADEPAAGSKPSPDPSDHRQLPAATASGQGEPQFLRLKMGDGQSIALETSVISFRSNAPGGVEVDLIGAVHVGEAEYYSQLNELFDSYQVLLYELVAPEGTVIPRGGRRESQGFNPIALMQDGAKNMLGLESQLELIDYTKPHFVRADMTPSQIAEKMAERGDTAITLALDTFADLLRQQNLAAQSTDAANPLMSQELTLTDMLGEPLKMKRLMAQQFAATGSLDMAMGESLNQLLIVDRNAEALKGLQKQIAAGKKKIGIFYGAAHLPDLEKRLEEDFGLVKADQRWIMAWDLTRSKQAALSEPANLLLNLLKVLE
jgi:hypothetical protein